MRRRRRRQADAWAARLTNAQLADRLSDLAVSIHAYDWDYRPAILCEAAQRLSAPSRNHRKHNN